MVEIPLHNEIEKRFGVLPNFFRLASDTPEVTTNLWGFAKFAYLDSPLPSLFKERLFVYLSRFCEVRYCIARHIGFLVGLGYPAGDRDCLPQTVEQVLPLLQRPLPRGEQLEPAITLCATFDPDRFDYPNPDTAKEAAIFACATHAFLQTPDAPRAIAALRQGLGTARMELLNVFLAFVRMAHYWTQIHPELRCEDDINHLLITQVALTNCLFNDPEVEDSALNRQVLKELVELRQLQGEHKSLEQVYDVVSRKNEQLSIERQDLQRVEENLRDSEARFRSVFSNNMVAMGIWTDAGGIIDANDALLDLIGYTRLELEAGSIHWIELTPPEYGNRDQKAIAEVMADGACTPYEKEFIHKDGHRIPIMIGGGHFDDQNGAGVFFALDLTDRKRVEDERNQSEATLRESEERFRELANDSPILIWIADEQANISYANQTFLYFVGLENYHDFTGHVWESVVHPDDIAHIYEVYGKAVRDRQPYTLELRYREAITGAFHWHLVKGVPRYVAGQFAGFMGTGVSIHDRKQSEAIIATDLANTRLLRDLSARMISEDNIQVLYDEILAAAIALTQADAGTVQILDDATQDVVLLAAQGFDRTITDYFYRVNASSNTSCGVALTTGTRAIVDFDVPEGDDPHGSLRVLANAGFACAQSTPLISRSGKAIGMVSTHWRRQHRPSDRELRFLDLLARQAADLIEQRRTEAERQLILQREQAARAEAERANRIKDEFLAVLSHELRSPLNPILGWSKLLQQGKLNAEKTATALTTIERNAQLQAQLIDDLLDVSRILRGKLSLTILPVDLSAVISAALETVRLAAEAKTIQIQTTFPVGVGIVLGDAGRLQQVVWNLLSNAIKFTPREGHVTVALTADQTQAQIQVTDNGKGIRSDFLPYVFEHFRQEDGTTTRKFGGLGLGLAIARQLTEMHGGQIRVDSPGEGVGATFTVQIPLASRPNLIPPAIEQPSSLTRDLSGIHILVVDDDADSREFVSFVLERANAIVTSVASGIEALQTFSQSVPNLVVSDIGMPEMDGYMLLRKIRSLPFEQGGQIPAIALTAYAGEIDQQQAIAAGFQRHLAKPINSGTVVAIITELVSS